MTEVLNLSDDRVSLYRIFNGIEIDRPFVGDVDESVESGNGFSSPLLESKYEIGPLVEVLADVFTLKRLTINADETTRIALGPLR